MCNGNSNENNKPATTLQNFVKRIAENELENVIGNKKVAITFNSCSLTYKDLNNKIQSVANGLITKFAIRKGDRVAFFLPNCLEILYLTLACAQIGAVAVSLNYRYVENEVKRAIEKTTPRLLVYKEEKKEMLRAISNTKMYSFPLTFLEVGNKASRNNNTIINFDCLMQFPALRVYEQVKESDATLILFSSGSTGLPKGIVHTHGSVYNAFNSCALALEFSSQDVVMIMKPLSHAGGLITQLFAILSVGGETVLTDRPNWKEVVTIIDHYSVTITAFLTSFLGDFIDYIEKTQVKLPSLKSVIGSGDVVPDNLHQRFLKQFGFQVIEGCGLTEYGSYFMLNPRFGKKKPGSIGKPTPGLEFKIVNDNNEICKVNEMGEICIRASEMMSGYWNEPEKTRELFSEDGFMKTGDLVKMDEEGFVWFVSRKKFIIVRQGSNMTPYEIENILVKHPLVQKAICCGINDEHDGEVPVATLVLKYHLDNNRNNNNNNDYNYNSIDINNNTSNINNNNSNNNNDNEDTEKPMRLEAIEKDIRGFMEKNLSYYKNPVYYHFVSHIPTNSTGKYDRALVKTTKGACYVTAK